MYRMLRVQTSAETEPGVELVVVLTMLKYSLVIVGI